MLVCRLRLPPVTVVMKPYPLIQFANLMWADFSDRLSFKNLCQLLCLIANLHVVTTYIRGGCLLTMSMPSRKAKSKALIADLGILIESAKTLDPTNGGGLSVAARIQVAILRAHLSGQTLTVKSLALEVAVSVTTLRTHLVEMADAELIRRVASERDARSAIFHPTKRLLDRADLIFELGRSRSGRIGEVSIASLSRKED